MFKHYALKVETLVKQGRYKEHPYTINLKVMNFLLVVSEKTQRFCQYANKRQANIYQVPMNILFLFSLLLIYLSCFDITLQKNKRYFSQN